MKRLWEAAVASRGFERLGYFPLLLLLWLVTPIYQFFSRRQLKKRREQCRGDWKAQVISIGNITVGGAGKTPVVLYLARLFVNHGKKVAVVHSGYGRQRTDDLLIDYGHQKDYRVEETGDETAMMADAIPGLAFAVGRDKRKMVNLADQNLRPEVIIIDDGYQRLDIRKDVEAVVLSAASINSQLQKHSKTACRPFPGGIWRETLAALSRADAIFITGTEDELSSAEMLSLIRTYNNTAPVVTWKMILAGVEIEGKMESLEGLKNRRPFLFAGVGSYPRLKSMIDKAAVRLAGDYRFEDHIGYGNREISRLTRLSAAAGADCYLTTAKDMVKLPPSGLDKLVYCLCLEVRPDDAEHVNAIMEMCGL